MTIPTLLVPRDRRKTVFGLVLCVAFVACSWWLWTKEPEGNAFRDLEAKVVAPPGMVVFGFFGAYLIVRLFDTRPALILNESGIHDRSGLMGHLHVAWEQVNDVDEARMKRVRLLLVRLKDPDAWVARYSGWKRWALEWNLKQYGTPFVISANALRMDFDALRDHVAASAHAARANG